MNEGENKTNWIIGIIVAFVVGLGLGWVIWADSAIEEPRGNQNEENISTTSDTSTNATSTLGGGEALNGNSPVITVDDQLAGTAVAIREVQLSAPTWVAVREDREGTLGNILGAQWLPAGIHSSFDIELLRGIIPNGTYYVVLYQDDGDKEFNFKKDTLISDENGVITARFTTSDN